eukprot:48358-Rhodomonas_salina.1
MEADLRRPEAPWGWAADFFGGPWASFWRWSCVNVFCSTVVPRNRGSRSGVSGWSQARLCQGPPLHIECQGQRIAPLHTFGGCRWSSLALSLTLFDSPLTAWPQRRNRQGWTSNLAQQTRRSQSGGSYPRRLCVLCADGHHEILIGPGLVGVVEQILAAPDARSAQDIAPESRAAYR